MSHPERIKMAESNTATETGITGSTATLTAEQEPLSAAEVVKEAESVLSQPPQTGPSITAENVTSTGQQPAEQAAGETQDTTTVEGGNGGVAPLDAGGGGRGPEGPRGPLPPDYLWSPEFRAERWNVVKELLRLEGLPYAEKYNNVNEPELVRLFRQWRVLEALDNQKSYLRKPFDPTDLGQPTQAEQPESFTAQDLTGLLPVRDLFTTYNDLLNNPNATPDQINSTREQLSRYFREAKRRGLLEGVDAALKSVAKEIQQGIDQGLSPDEIMTGVQERYSLGIEGRSGVDRRIDAISDMAERTFRTARRTTPEIANLEGVWDSYIQLALERLTLPFTPRLTPPLPIEGEFTFEVEQDEALRRLTEEGEIYWRPTYANYFTVYARNREQFDRAKETFIRWMRTGLGKAPEELFSKVNGFKEALTSAGQRAGPEIQEYTVELRRELEAIMGIIGAYFFNEQYNADYYKQFWTFAAQHEGPARMLRLARTSRGRMAAILWKFDKDPRLELLFSPHGSRGQLMGRERNASEMGVLQEQILAQLAAETIGIAIKEYHPDDLEKRLGPGMYEGNLAEITKFQSDEKFKNLYEGFDLEEQADLYRKLANKQRRINRAREIQEQLAVRMLPSDLQGEDLEIYEELSSGRQFSELLPAEKLALDRLEVARRIQEYLEKGGRPEDIKRDLGAREAIMYQEAINDVTLTYELYGAMGDKAKRGGGIFLVDRRGSEGPFRDYIPVYWAGKFVHFAENWTKATYGNLPAAELKYKVDQARRMAIWALKTYGFDAKLWDFTLLRDGKPVDPNTLGYSKYGENRNEEDDEEDGIERYRYAVPENPRILGYNSEGKEVILVFDDDGKPIVGDSTGLKFDADGQAEIYDKPTATYQVEVEGQQQIKSRERIRFDNLNNINTKADRVLLKMPGYPDGKPVDFDTATHHIYSRWTGHPYWGYQEEDTGLILSSESFDAARRIKSGQLRWEDAPPHAVQLLIVDPTLERVGHFDLENLEAVVTLAAVEESYQSHWRIGDELYMNFYPEDASRVRTRVEYVLQDHGGSTKQWFHARSEAALWPDSRMRRLRTFIPFIPLHLASMSEMWGAPGGALDVFRMMGYGKYRMVGQFAMDKWVNQTAGAQDVYESILGFLSPQEHRSREGLGEKPTNDADSLQKWHEKYNNGDLTDVRSKAEDIDNQYVNAVRESLNRFEVTHQRLRVLETDLRGERTPLWLEGIDIFQRRSDGTYEEDENGNRILNDSVDWKRDSGSSRHSGDIFFWRFIRWLRSDKPREGQDLYPTEALYYSLMDGYTLASKRVAGETKNESRLTTRWEWLLGKINR